MKKILIGITIVLLLLAIAPAGSGYAAVEDQLGQPLETPIGTFGGTAYVQYDGIFEGQTSTGTYRVPYRITAPADRAHGNRTILVEPSHFVEGLGTLDFNKLGPDFLFTRGFAHAGIGWSTTSFGEGFNFRILDPTVPGVFINGGFDDEGGRTDDEIIVDFARTLGVDPIAQRILGRVDRRYLTGFSDSSVPILRLITSGLAARVFDFALPFTTGGFDPQTAITNGLYRGKLIIVNSESEGVSADLVDRGSAPDQYRFYAVAGTPHLPDPLVPFFSNMTSPASLYPALRAHFLQGDTWVKRGTPPPPSTRLKTSDGVTLDRDANGNAISVNGSGQLVPRLPFIELGEARFIEDGFLGSYDSVKTISDLGFRNHDQYARAFTAKLADYLNAGYILRGDAEAMRRRVGLCPSRTFTEVYRDAYQNFVAIEPCG
jgi:hypothetical protein